jgi:hypothetical protein
LLKEAKEQPFIPPELASYRSVLRTALMDGIITGDEEAMLATLRQQTNISEQDHATLLAELQDDI